MPQMGIQGPIISVQWFMDLFKPFFIPGMKLVVIFGIRQDRMVEIVQRIIGDGLGIAP